WPNRACLRRYRRSLRDTNSVRRGQRRQRLHAEATWEATRRLKSIQRTKLFRSLMSGLRERRLQLVAMKFDKSGKTSSGSSIKFNRSQIRAPMRASRKMWHENWRAQSKDRIVNVRKAPAPRTSGSRLARERRLPTKRSSSSNLQGVKPPGIQLMIELKMDD